MKVSARRATAIVCLSEHFESVIASAVPGCEDRITVVTHERPTIDFVQDQTAEVALGVSRPYVLCVSHLWFYKNIVELIHAFAIATQDRSLSDLQLVIVGSAYIETYHKAISDAIESVGDGRAKLLGRMGRREIGVLLGGCELFVFPSSCECCPIGLLEAMEAGCAIASSNAAPMPEFVGSAAVYFDPKNVPEMATVLRAILSDKGRRESLRTQARSKAKTLPSSGEVSRRLIEVIESARRAT
jgi:glycosyltransferase involved in cell wall biosynthesis